MTQSIYYLVADMQGPEAKVAEFTRAVSCVCGQFRPTVPVGGANTQGVDYASVVGKVLTVSFRSSEERQSFEQKLSPYLPARSDRFKVDLQYQTAEAA